MKPTKKKKTRELHFDMHPKNQSFGGVYLFECSRVFFVQMPIIAGGQETVDYSL